MPPKRKAQNSSTEVNFAVIETIRGDADVVVEFVPQIWLRPVENKCIAVRETAKCFYPRRMENQNVDQYLNHLKRSKFECNLPKYTKQWELLDCRVLRIGIGSFVEAVNAEKCFSDFFNTTDAEAEMAATVSGSVSVLAARRVRKIKKPKRYVTDESESDDEGGNDSNEVAVIPCYNTLFKAAKSSPVTSSVVAESAVDTPAHESHVTIDIRERQLPTTSTSTSSRQENANVDEASCTEQRQLPTTSTSSRPDNVNVEVKELLTTEHSESSDSLNVASIVDVIPDIEYEAIDQEDVGDIAEDVIFEFVDQRSKKGPKVNCSCKCCQKLVNKVDYMQKKLSKELGRYRQEMMQAIRQLSDKYDSLLKSQEFNSPDLSSQAANRTQMEEFETKFKSQFPAVNKLALIGTNETISTERDFKRLLTFKLKCIVKEERTNETTLTRLILKIIGSSGCWSEFTWTGTDKKANFSELESLIEVITTVVECQFPTADAFKTLKSCVQQRTKSAAEFEAKKRLNNGETVHSDTNTMTEPNGNNDSPDLPVLQMQVE